MKLKIIYIYTFLLLFTVSCATLKIPQTFKEVDINTSTNMFLKSYIKNTSIENPVYIYVEGDGYAFNSMGRATKDPTPNGTFMRELAFGDNRSNVVYLARPCQYIMSKVCSQVDWTTGRYSPRNVKATIEAIKQLSNGRPVVLIGFSGGALMSGLVIQNSNIKVDRWITISGLLNHTKWTKQLNLVPLTKSLDLKTLPQIKQIHIVGDKDNIVPKNITESLIKKEDIIILNGEKHTPKLNKIKGIVYRVNK